MEEGSEDKIMDKILASEDNCDIFIKVVMEEIQSDDETYRHKAHQLIKAYREHNCENLLVALCGWSMHTLLIKYQQKRNKK